MKFVSIIALFLVGCAATKAPSTKVVHEQIGVTSKKIESAQASAKNAKEALGQAIQAAKQLHTVDTAMLHGAILKLNEADKYIDLLTQQLLDASTANKIAELKLIDYDKKAAKREAQFAKLEESRHRWVKFSWLSGGTALAALIWIFRKPLLLLAGI